MAGGCRAVGRGGRVSAPGEDRAVLEPGPAEDRGVLQPVLAGVMSSLVGFASSFAVVLAGLRAVGADAGQAASGLLVLCVGMGATAIVLSRRRRLPLNIAWSTPGAALLIAAGPVHGGYPAALGAFLAAGLLTVLAGLWRPLGRWIAAIPAPLANALLAGVLLSVCVAPVRGVTELPWLTLPVVVTWAVLGRVARRWAVPGALVAAAVAIAVDGALAPGAADHPLPTLTATLPVLDVRTLVGVGLPLFLVTMASQNLAGMSVLRLHGYDPELRPILLSTGAVSVLGAPFGAHAINLAAITAGLTAGPDAHPDPGRRWIATVAGGVAYLVLGISAGLVTAVIAASPPVVIEAVAGLALLGALAAALGAATADPAQRDAAIVTFVVSASGLTLAGISAPFWGLVAGLALLALARRARPQTAS
ncbi:MAG: benzoate rane transport protein [Solirubrobacteraceae bacterium]|nr:benzoate rane transport protein [Solirubrobacteraceae bacterium]